MPTTKTITVYSAEERRNEAFNRWSTVSNNLERWKAEAVEAGDEPLQLRLNSYEFDTDFLWRQYLMQTSFQMADQVRGVVNPDHDNAQPDARQRISLLDTVLFILERGTTEHIERADNALRGLFEEVDIYVSPEEIAQALADAQSELSERDAAIAELETMLTDCQPETPAGQHQA